MDEVENAGGGWWLPVALTRWVMFILIITIPFGVQSLKLAAYALWPFGHTVVKKSSAGAGSVLGNLLWIVLCGWWLALAHVFTALLLAITIIGLPLAVANLKLARVALWPFGREIVPVEVARRLGVVDVIEVRTWRRGSAAT